MGEWEKGAIMAKIFRFSGYFVDGDVLTFDTKNIVEHIKELKKCCIQGAMQQLHVEESEYFDVDGELDENCDLALLTRHFKKDIQAEYDRPLPKVGEVYRHFKIGKCVKIIGISRHTETEEIAVVYEHEDTIWCRPLEMFMSEVDREKYPEATQKYRFERVE